MSRTEVRALEAAHIDEAAVLLAGAHAAQRSVEPGLSPRFADPAACAQELEGLVAQPGASGAVALRNGRLTGFVIGAPKPAEVWGPNMWVEAAGQAAEHSEDLRDMYGLAAARWAEEGRSVHYVLTRGSDEAAIDAWFRIGFGQQHVHALRESALGSDEPAASWVIRRAEHGDVDALAELDRLLPIHQAGAPVFSPASIPALDEARAEWEESISDPDYALFVADLDGAVVGSAVGASVELSSIHVGMARPDRAAILGFAAVQPAARGSGIGQALGRAVLHWAAEESYPFTVTDWRSTNLLSSRTWPRLGFRTTFVRLHRVIGY